MLGVCEFPIFHPQGVSHDNGQCLRTTVPTGVFLIVGLFLSSFWSPDPVLFIAALITAGMCAAWLIVTTVEVVKKLPVEPSTSSPAVK